VSQSAIPAAASGAAHKPFARETPASCKCPPMPLGADSRAACRRAR
jgi:hypothetical protein